MNFLTDLGDQLSHFPHWMMVLIGLTLFGIYYKRSMWPNRYLKFINLILPTLVYPCIHYSTKVEYEYWSPVATLAIQGFALGILSEFTHEGIVAKLKLMGMKFPEEERHMSKADTAFIRKDSLPTTPPEGTPTP